jgi:ammonia channel protein AmtB
MAEANETSNVTEPVTDDDQSPDLSYVLENMDHFFLLVMGAIILFMQSGFAFIEVGTVRAKNATSILLKNISDACFGNSIHLIYFLQTSVKIFFSQ